MKCSKRFYQLVECPPANQRKGSVEMAQDKDMNELEHLQKTLEYAPCGVGIFEIEDGTPVFLNQMYFSMVGYSREEYHKLYEAGRENRIFPSDLSAKYDSAVEFKQSGTALDYEYRIIHKNESIVWLKMSASTVSIDDRKYAFVSFTDITKEKEAQLKAELEQRRFQTVIRELDAAVFEWNFKDRAFYTSEAYQKYAISRVNNEDILCNRGPKSIVHQDDALELEHFLKSASEGREHVETVLRLKLIDGTFHWCRMLGFYYKDDEGTPNRIVGVIIDINEERERSFMLNSILNEMPGGVGVFALGEQLSCQYFSDGFAGISGRTREEVARLIDEGTLLSEIIAPADYEYVLNYMTKCVSQSRPMNLTFRYQMKNGEIRWLHLAATKLKEEDGNPIYYCVFTNPTDETALYQSIVEDSAVGVFVGNRKTRNTLYINDMTRQICGVESREVIMGKSIAAVLKEKNKKPLLTQEEIESLNVQEYSEFHISRGSAFFGIKAKAVTWNGVDSYIMYITDETQERERQAQLQLLMSSIPGGVAIYRIKKDGRAQADYVSEGFAKMCGYEVQELYNLLHRDSRINVVPEDLNIASQAVMEKCEQHKTITLNYRIFTKDRKKILIRLDANQIPDAMMEADDVAVLYAVHTRVSEESMRALQEQKRYRRILNMTETAYFEWDSENGFYASEKFEQYAISQGGFSAIMGDARGMESIHPEDLSLLTQYMFHKQESKSESSITIRLKMVDGSYRYTEVFGYVDKDEDGNYSRLIGVLRDVDEEWTDQKKKLQAALDEAKLANRAKTDFLSRVSHDMRTPLNGILGLTSLLKDSVTDKQIADDVEQLELSGRYLLNLINDTLDMSRIESGRLELHPIVCEGRTLLQNVINLARPNMEKKHLNFRVNTGNPPFTMLYIDVGRVEQIMMNILGNAVKFTPEGGIIDFTIEHVSLRDHIITNRISIRDNGIGMSAEFLPHLFEPFTQENNSTTSSSQGTGLGMGITRQLIELMGGEITVESELGKGSCFTFTLDFPMASAEQVEEWKKQQNTGVDDTILKGKRVLLCEDHPLNVQIATRLLKGKGMLIEHAENGQAGVDMLAASPENYYDVVLMDIRMPVMDGMEATRRMRSLPRKDIRLLPIIAMTANAFDEDVKQAKEAGMNAHLSKPIDQGRLYAVLEEQLHLEEVDRKE